MFVVTDWIMYYHKNSTSNKHTHTESDSFRCHENNHRIKICAESLAK